MRSVTLIDGSTQSVTLDALGRRTAVITPWWNWTVNSQNGYDPVGNLIGYTTVDPVGTLNVVNGYSDLYQLTGHDSAGSGGYSQGYAYDSIGNRLDSTSTFLTGSTTSTYAYAYNELNELTSRTDPNGTLGGTITVPVRGLAKPNPYTTHAITAVTVQLDSNPAVNAQLIGEEWELAGGGIAVPVDGTNHTLLITATDADGKVSTRTLTLNYNATASTSYVYDLRGNLVQKTVHADPLQITSYTYDALNRLISVQSASSAVEYTYDPFNRRISKKHSTSNLPPSTVYYLWSGMNQIGIMDGNLQLTHFRLLGEGFGAEVGSAVAVEIGQTVYVPVHDFRGNVVCLVDKLTGTVAESYRYDAYGNVRTFNSSQVESQTSQISNPWKFSSKEYDVETGLYYFTRRYYDPSIGRFVTTDPLGVTDGVNMYGYAGANPIMFVDPSGLLAKNTGKNSFAHGLGAGWALYNSFTDISDTWGNNKIELINPFTKLSGNFFAYELLMGAFHAAGVTVGIPASFLSGDIYHDYGNIMDGARNLAISGMDMSGGFYTKGYAESMAKDILDTTGQATGAIDNPSQIFGFGSLVHTLLGELGVKFTPSVFAAQAVRNDVENLYAHSQGTLVVAGMSGLISDSQRNQLNLQTFGGEIQRTASSWGFNSVINEVNPLDMVPRLSPMNVFGGAWAGFYIPWEQGLKQHKWDTYVDRIITF
jgi:RHS repeat-associated protein